MTTSRTTEPLQGRSPGAIKLYIASRRSQEHEKQFRGDDPRSGDESGFSRLPFPSALRVTAALSLPLLLAVRGLPIATPRPSTVSSGGLPFGTPHCNSGPAAAAVGRPARSPSASRRGAGDVEPAAALLGVGECSEHLDFWQELANLYPGPWEWLLPEAQASKGRLLPLRGALDQGAELEPATLPQYCDQTK